MTFLKLIADKLNEGREYGAAIKLAKAIKYKGPAISDWVKGKKAPGPEAVKLIAKAIKEPEAAIKAYFPARYPAAAYGAPKSEYGPHLAETKTQSVPVIGTVSTEYFSCSLVVNSSMEVLTMPVRGNVVALRVVGEALEPEAHDGDIILVEKGTPPAWGELALVRVDAKMFTIKNVYVQGEMVTLQSANAKYKDMERPIKDLEIIGRVPEVVSRKAPKPFKRK